MTEESKLDGILRKLETERDELRVKANLAKMEAKEEWDEVEKKIEALKGRMKVVGGEAKEASGDVGAAIDVLADEIKDGFSRLRKML